MELVTTTEAGVPVIRIIGDIDHSTSPSLDEALLRARLSSSFVLLDLGRAGYLDSGGLSVILSHVRALRNNGWLGAVGANRNIERLFHLVGLSVDPSFRIFADFAAAKAALTQVQSDLT